jgi:hypothetical protein
MRIKKALKVEIKSEGEVYMMLLFGAFMKEFQIKI